MAHPTPTPSHRTRSPRKNNNAPLSNVAALQGALTAFHGTPPGDLDRSASHRFRPNMTARGVNRHHSGPVSYPAPNSLEPPEIGSVKDKIAKFSTNTNTKSLENIPRAASARASAPRAETPQHIAAQLAVARSPLPPAKATGVGVQIIRPRTRNGENPEIHSPIPIRKKLTSPGTVDQILQSTHGLPIGDTPVEQKSTYRLQPEFAHLVATKPRPNPPAPRRSGTVYSTASPAFEDSQPNQLKSSQTFPISHPALQKKASSSTLSEERPTLPPRRGEPVIPRKNEQLKRLLVEERRTPPGPSSSSTPSLYSQSQNQSSSDMLDTSSDWAQEGHSDAIVASSLASTRALQTKKSPPTPPPQRRPRSRSVKGNQQTFNPNGLRQTLRERSRSDDEDVPRRHRHYGRRIIHNHPHKHHEGDRKKWRSEVTEKERKRYEGVWAANKGLLISHSQGVPSSNDYPPNALEMVINLVVRDIWSRSRLPDHVLEQIWDLVDGQKIGLLTREEFVVGLWLIDQQLKGHKLPVTVPDSVWGSVKRVAGISLVDLRS